MTIKAQELILDEKSKPKSLQNLWSTTPFPCTTFLAHLVYNGTYVVGMSSTSAVAIDILYVCVATVRFRKLKKMR